MLAATRKELLLDRLRTEGSVSTQELARELDLSEDTLRRDLRELAAAGLCQRVYGGALPSSPAMADLATRSEVEPASKHRVAETAARLVKPGSTVILDGGTTTLAVAQSLPLTLSCTVITHSPTIASALLDHELIDVLILGGRLFKHSGVTCGSIAAEAAQSISADLFLLGVTGVHPDAGLTTGDAEEAAMKRTLASRAVETYVLASTEKIGAASPYAVLPLSDVAAVITDAPQANPTIAQLTANGTKVIHPRN
jgi:DeoR/GlpR family transcriptional regulator of sugar metabolism